MKQDRLAWYRWFPRDFRESRRTRQLTPDQRRLYREMLDEEWIEGPLPLDPAVIAAIIVAEIADVRRVLEVCFKQSGTGWRNERLERERVNANAWIKKSVRGGIESGKSRRGERSDDGSSTVQQPLNTPPTPSPTPRTPSARKRAAAFKPIDKHAYYRDTRFSGLLKVWPVERRGDIEAGWACWEGQGDEGKARVEANVRRIAKETPASKLPGLAKVILGSAYAPHEGNGHGMDPADPETARVLALVAAGRTR